jgi:hypothetical protein
MKSSARTWVVLVSGFLFCFSAARTRAQYWQSTVSPESWSGIACSADGNKLLGVQVVSALSGGSGFVYASTNAGGTWTFEDVAWPTANVAGSADGTQWYVADPFAIQSGIYSTGPGWSFGELSNPGNLVACSDDGRRVLAAGGYNIGPWFWNGGGVLISPDSGITWQVVLTNVFVTALASSSDGSTLLAVTNNAICISTNYGANWSTNLVDPQWNGAWNSVACSKDASQLFAASDDGVFRSSNGGLAWSPIHAPDSFQSIAVSADATSIVAAARAGLIYISTNSGVTWDKSVLGGLSGYTNTSDIVTAVAISADGTKMFAAPNYGSIYTHQIPPLRTVVPPVPLDLSAVPGLNDGAIGSVRTLAASCNDLYVGGSFRSVNGQASWGVAKWDGDAWTAMGTGLASQYKPAPVVLAMAVCGSNLFVGGSFITADGTATNLAMWNGTNWSAVGSGLDEPYFVHLPGVSALASLGNDLYVGGSFSVAGGTPATNVAKWDGTKWSSLNTHMSIGFPVNAMTVFRGNLYVGGYSVTVEGPGPAGMAKWDGTNWSGVGSVMGPGGYVSALATTESDLYAVGPSPGVFKWDGSTWSSLGSGLTLQPSCLSCEVRAVAAVGNDVYVAGQFIAAGGTPANGLARWHGDSWTPLDIATNSSPDALAVIGNTLYVGGPFEGGRQYLMRGSLPEPFLTISMTSTHGVVISWPSSTNTIIQQALDIVETNWVAPSEGILDDRATKSITVSPAVGKRFFRLIKP